MKTTKITINKIRKDKTWSLSFIAFLLIGLTIWMIVPTIASSLQEGIGTYENNVASYMFVYNSVTLPYTRLTPYTVSQIRNASGVETVYPIIENFTTIYNGSWMPAFVSNSTGSFYSAVIGDTGYPLNLITLDHGSLPQGAQFITNGNQGPTIGHSELCSVNTANGEYLFNATCVGIMNEVNINPLLGETELLWNETFLRSVMGNVTFNQTFGGAGADEIIIKAQNYSVVPLVVNETQQALNQDPIGSEFTIIYDSFDVSNIQSFQQSSGWINTLIGVLALGFVASMIFLLTYVYSVKKEQEAGLLITQGWKWTDVTKLFAGYYLVLGAIAIAISVPLSIFIASNIQYSFTVWAGTISVPITVPTTSIITSVLIGFGISVAASVFAVWNMKRRNLDDLLREV